MTAIHAAAFNGHAEIVKILVPLTDNPNTPNEDGETPIKWAISNGLLEIIPILARSKGIAKGQTLQWTKFCTFGNAKF